MKPLIIAVIAVVAFSSNLKAQSSLENILTEVDKNNSTLQALQKNADAEKIGNKTGIYLQNPEVEFNYLWGSPAIMGNRTDLSIMQTFDFPTAYGHKKQISNMRNEQVEFEYRRQLNTLHLQTLLICADLVYQNALNTHLSKKLIQAKSIANTHKLKFDAGEINILEYNKAQLNLLNVTNELKSAEIDRVASVSELTRLNGGNAIDLKDTVFQLPAIAADFEQWYQQAEQNNPVMSWLKKEIEISMKQEKLNRAMSLPKLQAGYMSEQVPGEKFQGVSVGITIPLWENKNTVKYEKAKTIALQNFEADKKIQFYNKLKSLHSKAVELQKRVTDYRSSLKLYNNSELLQKALNKGEISLLDYLLEFSIYNESMLNLLEAERELYITTVELNQFVE